MLSESIAGRKRAMRDRVNVIGDGMNATAARMLLGQETVKAIRCGMSLAAGTVDATGDRTHAMPHRLLLA